MDKSRINQQNQKYSIGKGQANVNLYNGRLLFEYPLVTIGNGNFQISTSISYNSHYVSTDFNGKKIGLGNGWKLNFHQYLFPYEEEYNLDEFVEGDYLYIDSNWCIHRFVLFYNEGTTYKYYDTSGTGLRVIVEGETILMYDDADNKYYFDKEHGYLTYFTSGVNSNIKKVLEYDSNNNLITICDVRKDREINFIYNSDGMLVEVNNTLNDISYELKYNNQKFFRIVRKGENCLKYDIEFKYNMNGQMTDAVNNSDLFGAKFNYYTFENNTYVSEVKTGIVKRELLTCDIDSELYVGDKLGEEYLYVYKDTCNYLTEKGEKLLEFNYLMSDENVYDINEFVVSKGCTIVTNKNGEQIEYYFNVDGTAISALHKKDLCYYTLSKASGWHLPFENSGLFAVETMNNHQIKLINLNNNFEYDVLNGDLSDFTSIFTDKNENGKVDDDCPEHFNLSFLMKPNQGINLSSEQNILAKLSFHLNEQLVEKYALIEKTYEGVWQKVSIPFTLSENQNTLEDLKVSIIGCPNEMSILIGDVRIEISDSYDVVFNYLSESGSYEETKLDIGSYIYFNDTTKQISSQFYLTESDIFNTYKSLYEKDNNNGYFELVHNNGTMVEYVNSLKISNIEWDFVNGVLNYVVRKVNKQEEGNNVVIKSFAFHNENYEINEQTISKKSIEYVTTYNKKINVPNKGIENKVFKNVTIVDVCGLTMQTEEDSNIITKYEYDNYGNLLKIEKKSKNDSNEVLTQEYTYSEEESLRENVSSVKDNDITFLYSYDESSNLILKMSNNKSEQTYEYDRYLENVKKINFIDKVDNLTKWFNELSYYKDGNIRKVESKDGICHSFENNPYQKIDKVYRNKLVYESKINEENQEIVLEEKVYQREDEPIITTTKYDKYQRLVEVDNNGDKVIYEYETPAAYDKSPYATRLVKVNDPYTEKEHYYIYDDNILSPSVKEQVSTTFFNKKYSNGNSEYKLKDGEEFLCINNSTNKPVSTYYISKDSTNNDNVLIDYSYEYEYDSLGRYSKKKGLKRSYQQSVDFVDDQEEDSISLEKIIEYKENTSLPSKYNYQKTATAIGSAPVVSEINFENVSFDSTGNITKIRESGNRYIHVPNGYSSRAVTELETREVEYEYDSFNRLILENRGELGEFKYTYDENCGMLKTVTKDDNVIKTFTYNNTILTNVNDNAIIYDNYGNIVNYGNATLTYNSRNLLSSYVYTERNDDSNIIHNYKNNYYYNHQGVRYKKRIEEEIQGMSPLVKNVEYYLDGNRILGEDWTDEEGTVLKEIRYFYDAEGISGIRYNGHDYVFIKDTLGNINKIMYQGRIIGGYIYDAWGNCSVEYFVDSDNDGETTIRDEAVLNDNPFRYRGYYYDVETNLFLVSSRYYSPELCRWISPDDIEYLDPESVNGLNLYCYCLNNPIMYVDPDGHMPKWAQWVVGGLAVAGLIVATVLTCGAAGAGAAAVGTAMLVGGVVSGGIEIIDQLHDTGTVDWTSVAISTLSGTAYGLVIGLTGGTGAWAVAGKFAVAGGTSLLNSWNEWDENSTFGGMMASFALSLAVSGVAQGAGYLTGKFGPKLLSKLMPKNPNHLITMGDIGSYLWGIPAVKTGVIRFAGGVAGSIFNDYF